MKRARPPLLAAAGLIVLAAWPPAPAGAQPIPAHPRDLRFEGLDFDPPVAADHRHVLSNGVVAFVVPDHTLPLVTVSVLVRTGDYLEPPEKAGLASLVGSQMRAGGTERLAPGEFDEEIAFLAANVRTGIDATVGRASMNCLTKDLDQTLDLFFEMLRSPRFDPDRLDLARSQLLQQMERRNDSTQSIEQREWRRLLRGDGHFTSRPVTQASVEAITREDLLAFHREHYHPGRFLFAISGDVEPEEILPKIEARLAGWPAMEGEVAAVPAPRHDPLPGLYLVDKDDVNQGRVSIGHLGTTRDNPDRYALTVMNDILGGGGFSARLLTRIRSDEGLAYGAYSSFALGTYYEGTFRASFQSRSETVARAAAIVLEEIDRIRSEPVSEAELATSIASFVETFTRNFSSAASTAGLFANDEYTGRDPSYVATYRERIAAVTADDVLRVARAYLHPERLVVLVVGDLGTIEAGDPDNPDYTLDRLAGGPPTRIPLRTRSPWSTLPRRERTEQPRLAGTCAGRGGGRRRTAGSLRPVRPRGAAPVAAPPPHAVGRRRRGRPGPGERLRGRARPAGLADGRPDARRPPGQHRGRPAGRTRCSASASAACGTIPARSSRSRAGSSA